MNLSVILITVIFSLVDDVYTKAYSTAAIKESISCIVDKKSERIMYLFSEIKVLRRYRIGLCFSHKGSRIFEG